MKFTQVSVSTLVVAAALFGSHFSPFLASAQDLSLPAEFGTRLRPLQVEGPISASQPIDVAPTEPTQVESTPATPATDSQQPKVSSTQSGIQVAESHAAEIQSANTAVSNPPPANTEPFNWVKGPDVAQLGEFAQIAVPEGYRFAGADDARIILRLMNNPVPRSLVGILTPESRTWFILFEFNDVGYVKHDPSITIDPAKILKVIREKVERQNQQAPQIGAPSIATVNWQLTPQYDASAQTLEWAIRAESGPQKVINHVVRIHGRRGVIDAVAVQPAHIPFDSIPLKELVKSVSFKSGETYADYQRGDKVSKLGLAELITTDSTSEVKKENPYRLAWIIGITAVTCTTFGGVTVLLIRRKLRRKVAAPVPATPVPAVRRPVPVAQAAAVPATVAPTQVVKTNGHGTNGNGHDHDKHAEGKNGDARKRRIFNYQKFYSDLILQVSDRAYEENTESRPSKAPQPGPVRTVGGGSPHMEMIAEQKNLIEEQQRLIREQTKLIEEKTRLIQEKNKVLEKQAELFGNSVYQ